MTTELFGVHNDFLSSTLSEETHVDASVTLDTGFSMHHIGKGILSVIPGHCESNALLLSAGVHGNETLPIELVNQLVEAIRCGTLIPTRPVLFILGHPEAMRAGERFIEFNMNRLFMGVHQEPNVRGSVDAIRAEYIEKHIQAFHRKYSIVEHFDLHTAIRDSRIERFALKPYSSKSGLKDISNEAANCLSAMGVEALVYQHKEGTTLSSHTYRNYDAQAFTVELGKVRPFGHNDLKRYENTLHELENLITGKTDSGSTKLTEYEVCEELIVDANDYVLHVNDELANFTAFDFGTTISTSSLSTYTVKHEHEYLIFPNSRVPIGQRAGLMLKRINRRQAQ